MFEVFLTLFFIKQQVEPTYYPEFLVELEKTIDYCGLNAVVCEGEEEWQQGNFSAYNATVEQCGKADGITASGKKVKEGRTLACPKKYKFGTEIEIEGLGVYECQDRGGAIKGNKFDVYMDKVADAKRFGRRPINFKIKQ